MSCAHTVYSTRQEQAGDGGTYIIVYCVACYAELSRSRVG